MAPFCFSECELNSFFAVKVQEAVAILEGLKDFMEPWPLYPYYRMTATLLLLLTGIRNGRGTPTSDSQAKLASLSAACVVGKLHHLALAYYNRSL